VLLALFVQNYGMSALLYFVPNLQQDPTWLWTQNFFSQYGLLLVFLVALTPIAMQPAVILATLANTSLMTLTALILVGRILKYLLLAYISSHAPKLLGRLWGVQDELAELDVDKTIQLK
jgi:membrane protein YqaA with SNARE-associated domain